jgi:hypothetical protein
MFTEIETAAFAAIGKAIASARVQRRRYFIVVLRLMRDRIAYSNNARQGLAADRERQRSVKKRSAAFRSRGNARALHRARQPAMSR